MSSVASLGAIFKLLSVAPVAQKCKIVSCKLLAQALPTDTLEIERSGVVRRPTLTTCEGYVLMLVGRESTINARRF